MNEFEPDPILEGVWTRSIVPAFDSRGNFREISRESYLPIGTPEFRQESISVSKKHVLRGMHYQENQWQLITLVRGLIQDVILCVEYKSENYLKSSMRFMDESGVNQILTAPGMAHGFANLGEEAIIHYRSSVYYGETPQHGIHWQSDCVRDLWEDRSWIISERDLKFPMVEIK
jgi:dTDP-4-dehydrorhamnose 3,5-epimerase